MKPTLSRGAATGTALLIVLAVVIGLTAFTVGKALGGGEGDASFEAEVRSVELRLDDGLAGQ